MPSCKHCQEDIIWAQEYATERWVPIDPETIDGEEQEQTSSTGRAYIYLQVHHQRHECRGGSRGRGEPFRRVPHTLEEEPAAKAPPPRPPPAAPRSPATPPVPISRVLAFATLHLLPSAPQEVVRAAHRALAVVHHPDRGGEIDRMVEINAAYDLLRR